jgi:hypothetical protein
LTSSERSTAGVREVGVLGSWRAGPRPSPYRRHPETGRPDGIVVAESLEGGIRRAAVWFASAHRRTILRTGPTRANEERRASGVLRWFLVAFPVIAVGLIFMGRAYYFSTPLYETADLAANSLQINLATHLLEIHGNYSRFGFHHPGPAFFYVYAAGEFLFFNMLHLVPAPHNGQLLAGALLQSAFLAAAIAIVARYAAPNRGLFVTGAIAVALVHFQLAGNPETSLWPPDQLVLPFACFVVVAIAVACGQMGLLPVLVLCGGFLVHGHVAQPLYVVPMATVACGLGFWRTFKQDALPVRGFIRRHRRSFLVALALLGVFLLPLLIDAIHGPNSNLAAVLKYLSQPRAGDDVHSRTQILAYAISFLGYPADLQILDFTRSTLVSFAVSHWAGLAVSLLALVVLPVALLARWPRRAPIDAEPAPHGTAAADTAANKPGGSRFFATYYGFLALGVALTLIWINIQTGPLFEFNSFFVYGLMFVAALPPLLVVSRRWPVRKARLTTVLVGGMTIAVAMSTALPLPYSEDPDGLVLNSSIQTVVAARSSSIPVLLDFKVDDWIEATGVALALERNHVSWFVKPLWTANVLGHIYAAPQGTASGPEEWFLTPPDPSHTGQIILTSKLAIYPRPPSLSNYPQAP